MAKLIVGVAGKYFKIDNGTTTILCQCGKYDYRFENGRFVVFKESIPNSPLINELLASIIDGATNTPFANQAAIETWLAANFFFIASGGSSSQVNSDWTASSGVAQILNKPSTFTPAAHSHDGNDITSGIVPAVRLGNTTPDNTKVLYGDSVWRTAPGISGLTATYFPVASSATAVANSTYLNQNNGGNISYNNAYTFKGYLGVNVNGVVAASNAANDGVSMKAESTYAWIQAWSMPLCINPLGNRVGIGTSSPLASAALDVTSTTGALYPPRMTTAQRNLINPGAGALIYNTDVNKHQGYNGTSWFDFF